MATSSDHPGNNAEDGRKTVSDLVSEMFPEITEPSGPPPVPIDAMRDILNTVARQNRAAEKWTLKATQTAANPIAAVLNTGDAVDVVIDRPGRSSLVGTLQIGHLSSPTAKTKGIAPADHFQPVLGASTSASAFGLAGKNELLDDDDSVNHDEVAAAADSPPLCLMIPAWPRKASLRGIDVTPLVSGAEDSSATEVLTTRRITGGFELNYLPEEEAVLIGDAVAINLSVVMEGGDHV